MLTFQLRARWLFGSEFKSKHRSASGLQIAVVATSPMVHSEKAIPDTGSICGRTKYLSCGHLYLLSFRLNLKGSVKEYPYLADLSSSRKEA